MLTGSEPPFIISRIWGGLRQFLQIYPFFILILLFDMKLFLKEDTQNDFLFIATPWIQSLKFILVYLKLPIIPSLISLLFFSLFHPPLLVFFCLISFSFVVVASDVIFSHTDHLQQHVIKIGVFSLEWVGQEVQLVFSETICSY